MIHEQRRIGLAAHARQSRMTHAGPPPAGVGRRTPDQPQLPPPPSPAPDTTTAIPPSAASAATPGLPPAELTAPAADLFNVDAARTEEERAIRATIRAFVDEKVLPIIGKCYVDGRFPTELIPELAELGVLGASLPEEYGC